MKKLYCFLAISCLSVLGAFANIGDTYSRSCKRYGLPNGTVTLQAGHGKAIVWFKTFDGRESISATFNGPDGRCDYVAYTYWNPKEMSETQIWTYLASNIAKDESFSEYSAESGRSWASRNCLASLYIAESSNNSGERGTCLQIMTRAHNERAWAAYRASNSEVTNDPNPDQLLNLDPSKGSI